MHTYIYFLFHVLFHYDLSQDIGYSSLCYTKGLIIYLSSVYSFAWKSRDGSDCYCLILVWKWSQAAAALPSPCPTDHRWKNEWNLLRCYHLKKNNTVSSALQLVDDSNTTRKVMHYALKPGEILCVCLRCCLWTTEWTKIFDTFRTSWFRKRKHLSSSLLHDVPSNLTFLPP